MRKERKPYGSYAHAAKAGFKVKVGLRPLTIQGF